MLQNMSLGEVLYILTLGKVTFLILNMCLFHLALPTHVWGVMSWNERLFGSGSFFLRHSLCTGRLSLDWMTNILLMVKLLSARPPRLQVWAADTQWRLLKVRWVIQSSSSTWKHCFQRSEDRSGHWIWILIWIHGPMTYSLQPMKLWGIWIKDSKCHCQTWTKFGHVMLLSKYTLKTTN